MIHIEIFINNHLPNDSRYTATIHDSNKSEAYRGIVVAGSSIAEILIELGKSLRVQEKLSKRETMKRVKAYQIADEILNVWRPYLCKEEFEEAVQKIRELEKETAYNAYLQGYFEPEVITTPKTLKGAKLLFERYWKQKQEE